jgi:hypothetical protein
MLAWKAHMAIEAVAPAATALVAYFAGNGDPLDALITGLATGVALAIAMGLWNLALAPYRLYRDATEDIKALRIAIADDKSPQGCGTGVQRRPSKTFTTEWHITIQNVGRTPAVFSAQMNPLYSFGFRWPLVWSENGATEYKIHPFGMGSLILFGLDTTDRQRTIRPIRLDPQTGSLEFVSEEELEYDGTGAKTEFRVTITSDPPMRIPIEEVFRLAKGGIQRRDGKGWTVTS